MKQVKFIMTDSSRRIMETIYDAIEEMFDVSIKWIFIRKYEDSSATITIKGANKDIDAFFHSYSVPSMRFL